MLAVFAACVLSAITVQSVSGSLRGLYVEKHHQDPSVLNYVQEPSVQNHAQEPSVLNYDQEPSVQDDSQEPSVQNYFQEPSVQSHSQEPSVQNYSQEPSMQNHYQEPSVQNESHASVFVRRSDDLKRDGVPPLGLTLGDVVVDMWKGRDFENNTFTLERLAGPSPTDATQEKAWVQVMGLQNSGTDLLNALLYLNFGWKLEYYSDDVDNPNHAEGFWRFANLQAAHLADHSVSKFSKGAVKVLMVVRNPLSWLRTMRVNPPREFEDCVIGQGWLLNNCSHDHPGGIMSSAPHATYANLMDVWNQWTNGYQHASVHGMEHSMLITYESIVEDPLNAMQRIASFLGIDDPDVPVYPDTEGSFGVQRAQAELRSKVYLDFFTETQKQLVCQDLDEKLQQAFNYDDCK